MESKICSYTEKNVRIQLVKIYEPGDPDLSIQLRYNRKVLGTFSREEGLLARYRFCHFVQEILVLRDSSVLSKIT